MKTYGPSVNLDAWEPCLHLTGEGAEERTRQERDRAEGRATMLVEFEKYGLKVLVGGDHGKPRCVRALKKLALAGPASLLDYL